MTLTKTVILHGEALNLTKNKCVYLSLVVNNLNGLYSYDLESYKNFDTWTRHNAEISVNFEFFEDENVTSFPLYLAKTKNIYRCSKPQTGVGIIYHKESKKTYSLTDLFHVQHLSRGFKNRRSESIFSFKGLLRPRKFGSINQENSYHDYSSDSLADALSYSENSSIPIEYLPNRSVLGIWLSECPNLVYQFVNPQQASKWKDSFKKIIKINQKTQKFISFEFAWPIHKFKVKPLNGQAESTTHTNFESSCSLMINRIQKPVQNNRLNFSKTSLYQNYPVYFCLGKSSVVFIQGEPNHPVLEIKYPLIREIGFRIDCVFNLIPSRAAVPGEFKIQLFMKNILETKFAFHQCEYLMEKCSHAANSRSNSSSFTSDCFDSRRKMNTIHRRSTDHVSDRYSQSKRPSVSFIGPSHSSLVEKNLQRFYGLKSVENSVPSLNNIIEDHVLESNVNTADTLMPSENTQVDTLTEEYVDVEAQDQKLSCKQMIGSSEISAVNMETMMWIANLEEKNIKAKASEIQKSAKERNSIESIYTKRRSEFDSSFSSIGSCSTHVKSRIKLCPVNDGGDFTSSSGIGTSSFNSSLYCVNNTDEESKTYKSESKPVDDDTVPEPQTIFKVLNYLKNSIETESLTSPDEQNEILKDLTKLMKHPKVESILSQMIKPSVDNRRSHEEIPEKSMRSEKLEKFFNNVICQRRTIASCNGCNRSEFHDINFSNNLTEVHHSPSEDRFNLKNELQLQPNVSQEDIDPVSLSSLSTERSSTSSLAPIELRMKNMFLKSFAKNPIKSHRENTTIFAEVSYPTNLSQSSKDFSDYNIYDVDQLYSMNLDKKSFRKRVSSDGNNFKLLKLSKLFASLSNNQKQGDYEDENSERQRSFTFSNYRNRSFSNYLNFVHPSKTDLNTSSSIKEEIDEKDELIFSNKFNKTTCRNNMIINNTCGIRIKYLDDNYSERY